MQGWAYRARLIQGLHRLRCPGRGRGGGVARHTACALRAFALPATFPWAAAGNCDFRRTSGRSGISVSGSDHDGESWPASGRKVAVSEGARGIAPFTPEQVKAARGYADASRAASTRAKYLQHWTAFGAWCREHGQQALPAEPAVVAVHLSGLADAGIAPQPLARRLAALGYAPRRERRSRTRPAAAP